jgi:hypothetical protein
LLILGCGDDKKDSVNFVQKNSEKVTMDKLRSLGGDSDFSNFSGSNIGQSASSLDDDDFTGECQSGSLNLVESGKSITFSANNCSDGDVTVNGKAKMSGDEGGGFVEILENLTVKDSVFSLFAKKGSKISLGIDESSGVMTFNANFEASIDNEKFSAKNLSIVVSANKDSDGGSLDIKSGEVNVGGLYFKVEPGTTPIVVDDNGLVSGVIKLTDGSGQKMEIAVASANEVAFKIDENGDGEFSDSEITIENVEDFFNELSSELDSI